MSFDPSNPTDPSTISGFPTNERALRLFLQTYLQLEHGVSSGVHQFRTGTNAERDVIVWPSAVDHFHLWGKDDYANAQLELQYKHGAAGWKGIYSELQERHNGWTKAQVGQYLNLAPGATVNMDFGLGNFFRMVIAADVTIANPTLPTRPTPNPGACYFLELQQGGAGNFDIAAWGANFRFAGGLAPTELSNAVGSIDIIQMLIRYDGAVHVEILRDSL